MANTPALPQEMQDKLSGKIKEMLFDMLPDEKVNELLAKEIESYFNTQVQFEVETVKGNYNSDTQTKLLYRTSPFSVMVHKECNAFFKEKIDGFFAGPSFKSGLESVWQSDSRGNGEYVLKGELTALFDKRLEAYAMAMAKNMFSDLFASAVDRARSDTHLAILNAKNGHM